MTQIEQLRGSINDLTEALKDQGGPSYALGYLKSVLATLPTHSSLNLTEVQTQALIEIVKGQLNAVTR